MAPDAEIENSLVTAFVIPRKRDRYRALLTSGKGRDKLRLGLAHFADWDSRFASQIRVSSSAEIYRILRGMGAPSDGYVLSENGRIDGKRMELLDALTLSIGRGMGTVISCVPGRLALYEAEGPGVRYLLKREAR